MIETNDLYYASYLYCEGLSLSNLEIRHDVKLGETVYFVFNSSEQQKEKKLEEDYVSSYVSHYLASLSKLRDAMYSLINTQGRKTINEQHKNIKRTNQRKIQRTNKKNQAANQYSGVSSR
jgi:vacuolar-type H+-ATPase subunit D/Vma8